MEFIQSIPYMANAPQLVSSINWEHLWLKAEDWVVRLRMSDSSSQQFESESFSFRHGSHFM